ncbi:MAG: hypothetical protein PHD81_02200 [Candidatus Nanoarchaeia archaeon]|nr:hypothetical protein [Candidatus Nanoarchaeia archaeon]MDD5587902.1 hypothetical protein [Candidatus Nanoarchaeia archaeon]
MFKQTGKKGIGMLLYNAASVVLILLALALFVFLSFFAGSVNQKLLDKSEIEVNTILLNYLRTPVTVDEQEILVSDLIRLYVKNKEEYKPALDEINKKTLKIIFKQYKLSINGEVISSGIAMSEDFESGAVLQEMDAAASTVVETTSSEFNLPGFDKDIKIRLVVE